MEKLISCVAHQLRLNYRDFLSCVSLWDGSAQGLCALLSEKNLKPSDVEAALGEGERVITVCRQRGIDILHPLDDHYPPLYHNLPDAPVFLSYLGNVELLKRNSLAVVGSRQPLPWIYGWLEQEFVQYIKDRDLQVISGGAVGTDQLVHNLAIRSNLSSIAIIPSGIENLYPGNIHKYKSLAEKDQFGFISEYFPEQPMRKHHFFYRNRLISGFSPNLFVVQANAKSGTMITAQHAADQNRNIYTLVNSPLEPATLGNLQLLFDGAHLVRWGSDLP